MINLYTQQAVKKGAKLMHEDIVALEIMKEYGWTWEEYKETPERIVRLIIAKSNIDAKMNK